MPALSATVAASDPGSATNMLHSWLHLPDGIWDALPHSSMDLRLYLGHPLALLDGHREVPVHAPLLVGGELRRIGAA